MENLVLEEVPDITYQDIGGLGPQIEQIRDAVELPFLHPDLYREHGLKAPKGILLYGPPGCGKTLIAKAVANSLAARAAERAGKTDMKSYFLNIKGPELLDKYVGETERHIRLIFARAREKASDGSPVVVFFDEMDSLFRTRGTGISSDVETTIVPQLLSEIDGVERLDNVIVIGASNREDMIDPAILRPGRLDVKVKIQRPDAEAAADIFNKYITTDLPFHESDLAEHDGDVQATVDAMIQRTVEAMYSTEKSNEYLEVTYANGDTEMLYFKDFNSGAVVQNVVDRAKKYAIKDLLTMRAEGPADRPPAARRGGRVPRARGHAQHHQPGRLGTDLRQEGRTHHVHPHHRPGQGRTGARQVHRDDAQHGPVPVTAVPGRPAGGTGGLPVGGAMRVMGSETEYGIHAPSAPGANATMMSARVIQAYAQVTRQRAAGGAETRWDYTDEEPLHDARGWTLERSQRRPRAAHRPAAGPGRRGRRPRLRPARNWRPTARTSPARC